MIINKCAFDVKIQNDESRLYFQANMLNYLEFFVSVYMKFIIQGAIFMSPQA